MNSHGMINVEALLPSSLLDEVHNSDNESDSNSSINFNVNHSFFNENKNGNFVNEVTHLL